MVWLIYSSQWFKYFFKVVWCRMCSHSLDSAVRDAVIPSSFLTQRKQPCTPYTVWAGQQTGPSKSNVSESNMPSLHTDPSTQTSGNWLQEHANVSQRRWVRKFSCSIFGPLILDVESGCIPKHLQLKSNSSQMKTGILSVPSGFGECFPSQNKFLSTKRQSEMVSLLITMVLFSNLSNKGEMAQTNK